MSLTTRRCGVCGRFRAYREEDRFCLGCGTDELEAACVCGRPYDYALGEDETRDLFCPRCGRALRGRAAGFEG